METLGEYLIPLVQDWRVTIERTGRTDAPYRVTLTDLKTGREFYYLGSDLIQQLARAYAGERGEVAP